MKCLLFSLWIIAFCFCNIYAAESKYPETTKGKISVTARLNPKNGEVTIIYRNISKQNITVDMLCLDKSIPPALFYLDGFPDKIPANISKDGEKDVILSTGLHDLYPRIKVQQTGETPKKEMYRIYTMMPDEFAGTTMNLWDFPIWKTLPEKVKKYGAYRIYAESVINTPDLEIIGNQVLDQNVSPDYNSDKSKFAPLRDRSSTIAAKLKSPGEDGGVKPYFIIDLPTLEKLQKLAPAPAPEANQDNAEKTEKPAAK